MDYREDSKKIIKTTAYILAVISATSIIIYTVYAANTTIGTNITTSGNLTVGGASSLASATLSGNLTFSSSATTTIPNSAVNAFSFATSTSAEPLLSFTTSGQGHIGIGAVATTSAKLFIADIEATGTPPSSVSSGGNSRAPMIWVSSASDLPLIGIENTAADVRTALISGNISSPGAGGYLGTLSNHPLYFFTNDETRMALLANGYFGIGTSSPSQALSVHGNALFSGNLNVANVTATGTLTLTGTSGTSTINSITIGPNGKFGFSTTTPNIANFEVATRTIAFNSGADGSLGSWQTNPSVLPSFHSFGLSTIVANGYVYAIGGSSVSNSITAGTVTTYSAVDRAKLNSDGSIGAWQTDSNALPLAIGEHSSVAANGYVYAIGGAWGIGFGGATGQSAVYYAKLNSDGSTGAWKTNTNALPAALAAHTSVVANGYVYAIGGSSGGVLQSTVYYAKLNSDGSTGAWKTNANALTLPRYRHSSAVANGYVYVIGGYETPALPGADARVATIYYAKLNNDGSIGAWATNANSLPGVLDKHTSVVANGYVYVIGGANDIGTQVAVYYAKLNNNGSIGAWQTNSNSLTAARVSHSSVVANGYVYVFGSAFGVDIYYASTARTLISGNLDLLGLANTTLSDASGDGSLGSIGSSIFAGTIFSAGTLEVSGNTQLFGGLGVNGLLSVNASTSGQQNVPIFSIQNATGTSPILTAQYDGKVGIGTTSLASALEIQKPSSGSVFNISNNLNGDLLTINNSGYLGIGTTTPGALLSVQGNALFSGNLSLANLTATGTISVSGTSGTSTIGSITIGPNGKFGFSTTTPNIANFEVATRTIAFNSGADGALGSWATTNAFPAVRESHSSVIANGYVYVIGGSNMGSLQSTVYYAKLNSDGSTGAWSTNA
ncbi:MAG: hypothetical protein Q7S73_00620, partial [bacterium]|nr:hypothetical protein [bacterium]